MADPEDKEIERGSGGEGARHRRGSRAGGFIKNARTHAHASRFEHILGPIAVLAVLTRLGAVLGRSCGGLGASWGGLGTSWGHLGFSWSGLGLPFPYRRPWTKVRAR